MGLFDLHQPVEAVGKIIDELYTSKDEKLTHEEMRLRLLQRPTLAQIELNKVEALHRSVFVAGWRPFIGWVCGMGLAFTFVINPIIQWVSGKTGPQLQIDVMTELVVALLGLGIYRTVEKIAGRAK